MTENERVAVAKDEGTEGVSSYDEVLETGEYRLSKPYKFEEESEQKVLKFPLAAMTGQHIRTAQANYELVEKRPLSGVAETDKTYQAHIAAALMDVQPDFVFSLPAKDFTRLTVYTQRFLIGLA